MSFVDNVINSTKNAAAAVGKKTDEAISTSKLKFKLNQLQNDIKSKNEKLGALVYEMNKSGEKDTEAFDAIIAEIDTANSELSDVQKQLDALKGVVSCPGCGVKTDADNAFCPKCGAKLPEKPVEDINEDIKEDKDE